MVNRGDLLAFADDMLILTNSQAEMKQAIQELNGLNEVWNLRLNKAKSQVLTDDNIPDINPKTPKPPCLCVWCG